MNTIYICANAETICDGHVSEATHHASADAAAAFVEAAATEVLRRTGGAIDCEIDSIFPHWHGGRFDQFYRKCGLVAIPKDAPQELVHLAWWVNEAGCAARDEVLAEAECADDM